MANVPGMVYRCQAEAPWKDEFIGASRSLEITGYMPEQFIAGDPAAGRTSLTPVDRDMLLREDAGRDRRGTRRRTRVPHPHVVR